MKKMKDIPEVFSIASAARFLRWDQRVVKKRIEDREKLDPVCRLGKFRLYSEDQIKELKKRYAKKT